MEIDALRWFQLVADGVTVTEVADIFGVSQPGVSRALARLESDVGTPLLRRSGRLLRLTHAGAAFKAHVDELVNALDDGLAAVEQVIDPLSGSVSLAYPLSLGTWLVPRLLGEFGRVRPKVRFHLVRTSVGEAGAVSRPLAIGEADLELTTHRVSGEGVQWRRIAIEPLLLAVPRAHRLAGEEGAVPLADVATETFIVRRAPSGMRDQMLQLCRSAGFEPRLGYEVDDLPTVRGFVAAGLGVAVVPAMGLTAPTSRDGVRLLPLRDAGASRELGLAWLGHRRLPAVEAFRRFVLHEAESQ